MSESVIAVGACVIHGGMFTFDPECAPVIVIDPVTSRPPDVDEAGQPCTPSPEALARSRGLPYCPDCARLLNGILREQGEPPKFDETDTAEALLNG